MASRSDYKGNGPHWPAPPSGPSRGNGGQASPDQALPLTNRLAPGRTNGGFRQPFAPELYQNQPAYRGPTSTLPGIGQPPTARPSPMPSRPAPAAARPVTQPRFRPSGPVPIYAPDPPEAYFENRTSTSLAIFFAGLVCALLAAGGFWYVLTMTSPPGSPSPEPAASAMPSR